MKKAVFYLLFSGLFVVSASGTNYEITTPSLTEYLTLLSGDSLYMTTGSIGSLSMVGDSTAIIEGTSLSPFDCDIPYSGDGGIICMPGSYGIYHIQMGGTSTLAISGGNIKELDIDSSATVVLEQDSNKTIGVGQINITGNSSLSISSGHIDRIEVGGFQGGAIIVDPNTIISPNGLIFPLPPIDPNAIIFPITPIDPNGPIIPPLIDPNATPSILLTGGRIDEICSHRSSVAVSIEPSITVECLYYEYDESTRMLTGRWLDGTEFNIELIESQMSHNPTIDDIQFVTADVYLSGDNYIFDDAMYENNWVHFTGSATLIDGGVIGQLSVDGGSFVEIGGVTPEKYIPGGIIKESLSVRESAQVFIHGGSIGNTLEVYQDGIITLFGTDFKVTDLNGTTSALPPHVDTIKNYATLTSEGGVIPHYTGTITGTLADGSIINNIFSIHDPRYGGDIQIRPRLMAYGPVIISLSRQKTGLLLKNNSNLTVVRDVSDNIVEGIFVNSLVDDAFSVQGKASISADFLSVAGGMTVRGSLDHLEEMGFNEYLGAEDIPGFDEPEYAGLPDLCPVDPNSGKTSPVILTEGQWILEPGYYSAGIIIEDAAVSCLPGIYHLGGGQKGNSGLILKGTAVVDANEVMFHLVEDGQVTIGNDAVLTASALKDRSYHQGFLFFQSLDNTTPAVFKGIADCGGRLYFPANHIQIGGDVLCSMLMADTIELSSNAALTVDPGR